VTLAPASVSASAAEALLQVQEVLLTCSARGRALSDLNGLVEKKKATEIEEREWRPRAISSLRLVAALLAFGIRNLHRRQLARRCSRARLAPSRRLDSILENRRQEEFNNRNR
jgi:hypothetical protein